MFENLNMDEIKENPKVAFNIFEKDKLKAVEKKQDYIALMLNVVEDDNIELLRFDGKVVHTDEKFYSYREVSDFITILKGLNFYISTIITIHNSVELNRDILLFQELIKNTIES